MAVRTPSNDSAAAPHTTGSYPLPETATSSSSRLSPRSWAAKCSGRSWWAPSSAWSLTCPGFASMAGNRQERLATSVRPGKDDRGGGGGVSPPQGA